MKDGNVLTAKVLPIVTRLMAEKAAGGVSAFQQTTQFQHSRFSNAFSDLVLTLGKSGFDKGMARVFKTLADAMNDSEGTVKKLGDAFDKLSIVFEGVIKQGTGIINFLTELGGSFGAILPVSLALFKLIGAKGSIFGALLLALDDLGGYLQGKDSVLGEFLQYMKDLTGMDFKGIALGFDLVGLAILAAFSPITALALSIGQLIEAYKYLQSLKAANDPQSSLDTNKIPTREEVYNRKVGQLGQSDSWFTANVVAGGAKLSQYLPGGDLLMSTQGSYGAIDAATKDRIAKLAMSAGVYKGSEDWNNAMFAIQSGAYGTKQFEDYLTQRAAGSPMIYPNNEATPTYVFSGDINLPNVNNSDQFINEITNFYTGEGSTRKSGTP